jgi:hypothetical protein
MAVEQAAKVATSVVDVMRGAPVILALLLVIMGFLVFTAYMLGEVAENSRDRNKAQLQLIESLVKDVRDCQQSGKRSEAKSMLFQNMKGQ